MAVAAAHKSGDTVAFLTSECIGVSTLACVRLVQQPSLAKTEYEFVNEVTE